MAYTFKAIITLEKFIENCKDFKASNESFDISYYEFLDYFVNLATISKHNLVIGINFTYGWMPTILDFRSNNFEEAIEILNKAKNSIIPSVEKLGILKGLFNNSLVGTSKLLHFINPEIFAIWDSRVFRYLTGKEPNSNIGNCNAYLQFLDYCSYLTQSKEFDKIHNSICKKIGYEVTKFRTADLVMYSKGGRIK